MVKDIKVLLGMRIKELRKQKQFTQEQLAELVNIDQRNLSNIERGLNFPLKTLDKFATAFDISLKELFDFEHYELDQKQMIQFIQESFAQFDKKSVLIIYQLVKTML